MASANFVPEDIGAIEQASNSDGMQCNPQQQPQPPSKAELNEKMDVVYDNIYMTDEASRVVYELDSMLAQNPQLLKALMDCEESLLDLAATNQCGGIFYVCTLKLGISHLKFSYYPSIKFF